MLALILYLCYNCVTVGGTKKGYRNVALAITLLLLLDSNQGPSD
jgi:hypothetical protein